MKVQIKLKGPKSFSNMLGYFDLTVSIRRVWRRDRNWTNHETWRHVTLGFRSPVCYYGHSLIKRNWNFQPLRFGWGSGNIYLGVIYLITTFGRDQQLEYSKFGPLEWARPAAR